MREAVYLLHGLCRSRMAMGFMLGPRLRREGYLIHNFPYFSSKGGLEKHGEDLRRYIEKKQAGSGNPTFHLVGHSLGALISRYYAGHDPSEKLGRLVMLGPPNQPPAIARFFKQNWFYRLATGEVGQQLTDPAFYQQTFPICSHEIGVIAGSSGGRKGYSPIPEGDDDFIVAVEETKLPEMKAWTCIQARHTFMMNRKETLDLILRFLRYGDFNL